MLQRFEIIAKRGLFAAIALGLGLVGAASQTPTRQEVGVTQDRQAAAQIKPITAFDETSDNSFYTQSSDKSRGLKAPQAGGNPLWTISLDSLKATRERPIFSPTRRPAIVPSAGNENITGPTVTRPTLSLVGVIAGEKDGVAIFFDEITKNAIRLRIGDSHSGWTLQSVEGREATLYKAPRTAVLVLPNPPAK